MANARTRFDTIRDYLVRAHDAIGSVTYGRPSVLLHGRPFLIFHTDGMAFRVRGRVRLQALTVPGAKFWDPLVEFRPDPEWVLVPAAHFLRWDRFAMDTYRQQKEQGDSAFVRTAAPIPPPAKVEPKPAPDWATRLKHLTSWLKWTTSKPGEAEVAIKD
jgi:hypothetical protein